MRHHFPRFLRTFLCLTFAAAPALSQSPAPAMASQGTFLLHKFAKNIGKETYTLTSDAASHEHTLVDDFLITDRGQKVPLATLYVSDAAFNPISLKTSGRSSRHSEMNDNFLLSGHRLYTTRGKKDTTSPAPAGFFPIDGYSPVVMQQMLLRFWLARGRPAAIPTPSGVVHIVAASPLTLRTRSGQPLTLTGYTVSGLIWGVETLWLDDQQQLAALVSTDAEFDHFEAVREDLEDGLPAFISAAAQNDLAALSSLNGRSRVVPAKLLAITGATLIDGNGGPPIPNATVLLAGDTITAAGPAASIPVPAGATRLDASGKTLIPGLWDMHAHYEQVEWGPIYLAAGVTTARDCGNEFDFITTVRDTLQAGRGIGPRILIAGIIDGSGPYSLGAVIADTPEQALLLVRKYHDAGALQIKIYSSVKPAIVKVITAEAHRLGMSVTGHVPIGMTTVEAIEAGMDQINHIQYPARDLLKISRSVSPNVDFSTPDAKQQIAAFQQHHTVFDPTMALFEWILHPPSQPVSSFEPGIAHVAPQLVEALDTPGEPPAPVVVVTLAPAKSKSDNGQPPAPPKPPPSPYEYMLATLRELHAARLDIVAGTDQAIPGYSLHRELEIYVQAGFTPMEALQAATTVPARVMGLSKTSGSIEPGKRADIVILEADPLADIANTRRIFRTIAAGAVYDPAPLWQSVDFKP